MRRLAFALAVALAVSACGGPEGESHAPTGAAAILQVKVDELVQAAPPDEASATAFSNALDLARANPNDVGYPWLDPVTGELVVSAATERGRQLLAAAPTTLPHRIRT